MWTQIARHITQTTEKPFEIEKSHPVSGGCINQGYAVSGNGLIYFVKINQANHALS